MLALTEAVMVVRSGLVRTAAPNGGLPFGRERVVLGMMDCWRVLMMAVRRVEGGCADGVLGWVGMVDYR